MYVGKMLVVGRSRGRRYNYIDPLCDSLAVQGHILRGRHFVSIETSNLSTVCDTLVPIIFCFDAKNCAVGFHTISTESDTLNETFDRDFHTFGVICLGNKCLREIINNGGGVGDLHWLRSFDSFNIHGIGARGENSGQFVQLAHVRRSQSIFYGLLW